ncbi:MAG: 2-hydroxychromene-2-carboxylate isomerase [Minwuiales bacterium]|nr:2-hydroxychromene-2-carboxylate isomerase [Minwuiales bacterium]
MAAPITFYLEFSSPYAYLAAQSIDEVAERHGRDVLWRPISIAHIWRDIGVTAESVPRVKMLHSRVDAMRCAELDGVPFTVPANFPVDAKLARLAFYRLDATNPDLARRFAFAVFHQYWGEGKNIREVGHLSGLASGLRISDEDLSAALDDTNAKQRMIAATNEARDSGCFGVPWFAVDGETFWGHDRIPYIDKWLARQQAD